MTLETGRRRKPAKEATDKAGKGKKRRVRRKRISEKSNNGMRKVVLIIAAIVLLAAVALAAWFVFHKKEPVPELEAPETVEQTVPEV